MVKKVRETKRIVKREKEREVAFVVNGHKVMKMEDYICVGEGYGPAKYVKCPKEIKTKTTIYATSEIQTFNEMRMRFSIYAYPTILKGKWTYYIHASGWGGTYDWNGINNNKYYDTPEEAIKKALNKVTRI
jgi:hypothetical protein